MNLRLGGRSVKSDLEGGQGSLGSGTHPPAVGAVRGQGLDDSFADGDSLRTGLPKVRSCCHFISVSGSGGCR